MNIRSIEARARRDGCSRSRIVEGDIEFRCGHTEHYRSSEYGFAVVAGMSANTDCETCVVELEKWIAGPGVQLADQLDQRQAEFDTAVRVRNQCMAELGISDVYDRRISVEQGEVFRADARLGESKHAAYLLGRRCHAC